MSKWTDRSTRTPVARLARILLEHLHDTSPDSFKDIVGQLNTNGLGAVDLANYSVSMSKVVQQKGEITAVLSAAGTAWRGFDFGERSPIISDRGQAIVVVLPSTMDLPSVFRAKLLGSGGAGSILGQIYTTGLKSLDSLTVDHVTEENGDILLHNTDETH